MVSSTTGDKIWEARHQPVSYQIWLEGQLDPNWADWLGDFTITCENGNTCLRGVFIDQAALRGLVDHLWDFNLTLLSLERLGQ